MATLLILREITNETSLLRCNSDTHIRPDFYSYNEDIVILNMSFSNRSNLSTEIYCYNANIRHQIP
jgi:hypothetical protein